MAQFAGELPVDTLRQALPYLRRPFTETAVKFKIQSAWSKDNSKGAIVVTYIDARLVAERLNMIVADQWEDEYIDTLKPGTLACHLQVMGVVRRDVGEASGIAVEKALRSDALKRAAVKFGIGVSIYATPVIMLNPDEGLRPVTVKQKPSFALNDKGHKTCRDRYAKWLKEKAVDVFGEPLDHGDVGVSQGDYEVEESAAAAEEAGAEVAESGAVAERLLTPPELAKLKEEIEKEGRDLMVLMGAIGVEFEKELTNAHAFEIWGMLGKAPKAAAKPPRQRRRTER